LTGGTYHQLRLVRSQ